MAEDITKKMFLMISDDQSIVGQYDEKKIGLQEVKRFNANLNGREKVQLYKLTPVKR